VIESYRPRADGLSLGRQRRPALRPV